MEVTCWNVIQGSGTLLIGGIAVYIAWQQSKTNKNNLKLELYSKRYSVYLATKQLHRAVNANANITDKELNAYKVSIQEADFLFKSEVNDFLKASLKQAVKLKFFNSQYRDGDQEPHPENYNHQHVVDNKNRAIMWFVDNTDKSKSVFKPYLDFSNIK